jgi:AcrR family transcriptional regulator
MDIPPSTEKYEALLQAALRLFSRHGVSSTSTAAIAREAKVATGTLFHHFISKETLIDTLYLRLKAQLTIALKQDLDPSTDLALQFRQLWSNTLRWMVQHPMERQFFQQLDYRITISPKIRVQAAEDAAFLTVLLDQGLRSGVLKELPPAYLAALHTSLLDASAQFLLTLAQPLDDPALQEQLYQTYWDAIRR